MASKPKYAGWGLVLGGVLGAVFGLLADHVGIWLVIGVALGVMLGAGLRRKEPVCPECAAIHHVHEAARRS
jgi:uncharacterized membrane protein YgaE (UPF0421/DUF939 family)